MSSTVRLLDGKDHPVWTIGVSTFKAVMGFADPHIGEISSMQYSGLSGRGKREYDARRAGEWNSSAQGRATYERAVMDTFDAGLFKQDDDQAHKDARDIVYAILSNRKEIEEAKQAERERAALELQHEDLRIGMEVFHVIYRDVVVSKINRKTVVLTFPDGSAIRTTPFGLRRKRNSP